MTWREFRKWAGYPIAADVPTCSVCGSRLTIGEWPAYDWVCRNEPHVAKKRKSPGVGVA